MMSKDKIKKPTPGEQRRERNIAVGLAFLKQWYSYWATHTAKEARAYWQVMLRERDIDPKIASSLQFNNLYELHTQLFHQDAGKLVGAELQRAQQLTIDMREGRAIINEHGRVEGYTLQELQRWERRMEKARRARLEGK
jgi:hypothetical protein